MWSSRALPQSNLSQGQHYQANTRRQKFVKQSKTMPVPPSVKENSDNATGSPSGGF